MKFVHTFAETFAILQIVKTTPQYKSFYIPPKKIFN